MRVVGILNLTPDSFYDGGRWAGPGEALDRAAAMAAEGADSIDVGGASSRPGAGPIPTDEEWRRIGPVVERLGREGGTPVSVDTCSVEVARRALDAGAAWINDITACGDPAMADLVVARRCGIILMHMQGTPRMMQEAPTYGDVVGEVRSFLVERAESLVARGHPTERIWIDPGIGFGKTVGQNLELLRRLDRLVDTGFGVLVGASRKSFLGRILDLPVEYRLEGSLATAAWSAWHGAAAVRVHDVAETVRTVRTIEALTAAEGAAA